MYPAPQEIAAGDQHSCAIQTGSNAVVCWGNNPPDGRATPPALLDGAQGVAGALALGGEHSLAIYLPEPSATTLQLSGIAALALLARLRARSGRPGKQ